MFIKKIIRFLRGKSRHLNSGEHIKVCPDCRKQNTGRTWHNNGRFNKSGNSDIDKIIAQYNLEWIPYDRLQDLKLIGEGAFARIYFAAWLNGNDPIIVALKSLKNSTNMTDFVNEVKIHNDCRPHITQFYGITKDPGTGGFMMVLEYATFGNLREFLKNYFSNLKWKEKLEILHNIIDNLEFIHDRNYIHKYLHSGNVLQLWWYNTKITDMGLAQLIQNSKTSNSSNVCGVLPYIAPEVLNGKEYTFGSDVYSFGIIMIEVSTGKPPYGSVPHDEKLALAICNGLRPRVAKGTPQCYIDLVDQCLDANPEKRLSTNELLKIIKDWLESYYNSEFFKVDDESDKGKTISTIELDPNAIYISRSMHFENLPEAKNSTKVQIENPEVTDSELIKLTIQYFASLKSHVHLSTLLRQNLDSNVCYIFHLPCK